MIYIHKIFPLLISPISIVILVYLIKLFFLIKSINQDREILNNIVKKQLNHTDKNVFSVISNEIKIILDEKNSAR